MIYDNITLFLAHFFEHDHLLNLINLIILGVYVKR